jgi:hypothetical protein
MTAQVFYRFACLGHAEGVWLSADMLLCRCPLHLLPSLRPTRQSQGNCAKDRVEQHAVLQMWLYIHPHLAVAGAEPTALDAELVSTRIPFTFVLEPEHILR